MQNPKILVLLAPFLFLACGTVPDGFTPEAWERYQRENPNGAQVVRWIHESAERRELKRKCMEASRATGGDQEYAKVWFVSQAETAMIQGIDLKPYLVEELRARIESWEQHLESLNQSNAQNGANASEREMYVQALYRDKATLDALTH